MKILQLTFLILFQTCIQNGMAQTAATPIRFVVRVDELFSNMPKGCAGDNVIEPVWKFNMSLNGGWVTEKCVASTGQSNSWRYNYEVFWDEWRSDIPKINMSYLFYENSRGSACNFLSSGVCGDEAPCGKTNVSVEISDIKNRSNYPPARWNQLYTDYDGCPAMQALWSFRYSPFPTTIPSTTDGVYNFCSGETPLLQVTCPQPQFESIYNYTWRYTYDIANNASWQTITKTSDPSLNLNLPDVAAPRQMYIKVYTEVNGDNGLESGYESPVRVITVYPVKPVISNMSIVPPSCYGGGNSTLTLNTVTGKLGIGSVTSYRLRLEKKDALGNYIQVPFIDPYVTSIPYTLNRSKLSSDFFGAGDYRLYIGSVIGGVTYCENVYSFQVTEPPPLLLTASALEYNSSGFHISCNGSNDGRISMLAQGGTIPYTYQLFVNNVAYANSPAMGAGQTYQFQNLEPSIDYAVRVIDINGCRTDGATYRLVEPAPLTFTPSLSQYSGYNIKCNGGTDQIGILVNGGASGYSITPSLLYTASQGSVNTFSLQNVHAGTYNISVKDLNQCSYSSSVTLTEPPAIEFSAFDLIKCNGDGQGSVTVQLQGGLPATNGYSIELWNGGIKKSTVIGLEANMNQLGSADYSLVAKDKYGCQIDSAFRIPLSANIPSLPDTTLCSGQVYSMDITESGYTYSWNGPLGFNANTGQVAISQPGTYQLTATNSESCSIMASFDVYTSQVLFDANFLLRTEVYTGDTVVISEITWPVPDTVYFTLPSNFSLIDQEGALYYLKIPEQTGTYDIRMDADMGDCHDYIVKNINVLPLVGQQNQSSGLGYQGIKELRLYPNPSTGYFTLEIALTSDMEVYADIIDLYGNKHGETRYDEGKDHYVFKYEIQLTSGTYTMLVRTPLDSKTLRFIIQQ